jgi:hypothetical protein
MLDVHHREARILQRLDNDKTNRFLVFGHKDENLVRLVATSCPANLSAAVNESAKSGSS